VTQNKIYLKDQDIDENSDFIELVFLPYFKDIYKDLGDRSQSKGKGINKMIFIEVIKIK